ncbi:helix-turn-helix domain containing protein [Mycobacterium sp. CVI_P3]|uniref:Helix-turn-helix domain containing protein n=1 Tax=Mycobacterium pinniadriaticum TaxID=2994102 RepID=A0ABT3S7C0_9MYCO|nr:TetR/AcrR family transcriptional regulator [Mycobacterium pinniadriaticum]MCX2928737.1 helix-turn-helix domain containing protein [Mycobacterium pinniadriaticum]MCX2935396.1 helix-turn-helix domain containing protein [Mycobacterium pinniadriaticum]
MPSPARGLTQPERVETSRRRLMEAAAELIVEKGWEATTAAEIGRRAGYSRTMVHARFGGKEAILEDFLHEYVSRLSPELNPGVTGMDQVLAHIDRIRDLYAHDPDVLRAMFVSSFEAMKTTSPLRQRVSDQLAGGIANVADGLRKGQRDKSVRRDIDLDRAVSDITAVFFGIAFLWVALPAGFDLDTELAHARSRIVRDYGA